MHTLDVCILLAFVAYAVASGLRERRAASASLEEYFLAGRSLPGWKAGISMAATQFAADTPLMVTGLIATAGVFSLWRLSIYAVAFLLMGFVLAPCWRRARVLTDAELTELRYGDRAAAALRGVKAIYFGTIFNCTVLAMVLFAAKEVAEPFLTWHAWLPDSIFRPIVSLVRTVDVPFALEKPNAPDVWVRSADNLISIGAIVTVTMLYSTTGGLRSVVQTDVAQFAVMMLGTFAYAWWVLDEAGGMAQVIDRIHRQFAGGGPGGILPSQILAFTPSQARDAGPAVLAVFALQWLVQMNADGTGYLAQRSMACRSDRDAKQAALVFTLAQVVLRSLLWLPIGLGLLVLFPPDLSLPLEQLRADREASFVRGIAELLPAGVLGLMLTGMLAALASTVDTHLNWGASYWTNDIYKRFVCQGLGNRQPAHRELVYVARSANVLTLLFALAIMTQLSSLQTAWQASLLLGAGMGVMLVLRWLWWRASAWGELAAMLASVLLVPILLLWIESEALRLLLMAAGSTAAGVAASLLVRPAAPERLRAFYARVNPPGFWAGVAPEAQPEDRRRLGRGLLATALAALSVFCVLTGIGSWWIQSPAPVWFSAPGVWPWLLLVVGAALVPAWHRLAFGTDAKNAARRDFRLRSDTTS